MQKTPGKITQTCMVTKFKTIQEINNNKKYVSDKFKEYRN